MHPRGCGRGEAGRSAGPSGVVCAVCHDTQPETCAGSASGPLASGPAALQGQAHDPRAPCTGKQAGDGADPDDTAVETPQPPAPLALRTGPRRGLPRGAPLSSGAAWQRPGAESREVFPRQLAVQGGRWAWGEPPPDPVTGARVRHWRGGWLGAPASFSENSLVGLSGRWAREEHRGSNQLGGRKRGPGAARRPRTASEGSRSQAERASGTDEMFVQDASGRCLEEGGVLSPSGPRPPARRRGRGASPAPHAALVALGPVPSSCPCVTSARVRVASKTSLEAGVRT